MDTLDIVQGGAGLSLKKIKRVAAHSREELAELVALREFLPRTKKLPHTPDGKIRIHELVRENYGKGLLTKLKDVGAEYTFDEMLSLPEIVRYVRFTEDKPKLPEEELLDGVRLSASYAEYAEYFQGKSRTDVLRVMQRTLDLSDYYDVPEADIARCAVNLSRFLGEGDAEYYLNEGYLTTMRNVLKKRRPAKFQEEPEQAYAGRHAADRIYNDDAMTPLRVATLRFFTENRSENGLIPTVVDLRARKRLSYTTPGDIAGCALAVVAAYDFQAAPLEELVRQAETLLDSVSRAEKWNGFLYQFIDMESLQSVGLKYVPAWDAALLYISLKLLRRVLAECADPQGEKKAGELLSAMDLNVFLDSERDRFRFGYFPEKQVFDEGHYASMYGKGLLLHILTNTDVVCLEDVVPDPAAALVVNLFYPIHRYIRPRLEGERPPFWKFFLYHMFTGRRERITDRLYACCNWGMPESGDLEDLTYRPLSNALILACLDRDNLLRRLDGTPDFRFRRPVYLPELEETEQRAEEEFRPPQHLEVRNTVSAGDLELVCTSWGSVRCCQNGKRLAAPRLYLDGQELCASCDRYRSTPDGMDYLTERNGCRILARYRLRDSFSVSVLLVGGEGKHVTVLRPEETEIAFWGGEEEQPVTANRVEYDPDFALRVLEGGHAAYSVMQEVEDAAFTFLWRPRAGEERFLEETEQPDTRYQALAAKLGAKVSPRPAPPRPRCVTKQDLAGNYTVEYNCFRTSDFTYRFPAGKYLAAFSPLCLKDADFLVYDQEEGQAYSPNYKPLFLDGDYSVTLGETSVRYTACFANLILELHAEVEAGNFRLRLHLTNLLAKKRRLSVYAIWKNGLERFAERGEETQEISVVRYGETELAYGFSTSLNRSYERMNKYALSGEGKKRDAFFNHMLMPAMRNLPRYADCLGARAGDGQLAAFSLSLLPFDTLSSRRLLLSLLSRQSLDGTLPGGETAYLIPYLLSCYLECGGETELLDEEVGYADSEVLDPVRYHAAKCLELPAESTSQQLLTVFALDAFLSQPAFAADRYALVKRRDELKLRLVRRRDFTEAEDLLYELCMEGKAGGLYSRVSEVVEGKDVVSFGESGASDVCLALYVYLRITRVYGIRLAGEALSFSPCLEEGSERAALRCTLGESRLTLSFGGGEPGTVNVDGVSVSGDTRIRLPRKKRALKVRIG